MTEGQTAGVLGSFVTIGEAIRIVGCPNRITVWEAAYRQEILAFRLNARTMLYDRLDCEAYAEKYRRRPNRRAACQVDSA